MTREMRLHWELRYEWYSNKKLLDGFYNPLKAHIVHQSGKIIDIGCGQSTYILDMLESEFRLIAVDPEPLQLEYLKKRIADQGHPIERVQYSLGEFNPAAFSEELFSGVILSNLLQFFTLEQARSFVDSLQGNIATDTCILVSVHSSKHPSAKRKERDYFKYFYTRSDLYSLFPKKDYDYLYVCEKQEVYHNYDTLFLKEWLKQNYVLTRGNYDAAAIAALQENYLKEPVSSNLTIVVRRK